MSYHCGTVWPHDGALCAAGLKAYGFDAEALTVANGLFAASEAWNGRLPELFSGLDRIRRRNTRAVPDVVLAAGLGRSDPVPAAADHARIGAGRRGRAHGRPDP